jgi:hypothetical protein
MADQEQPATSTWTLRNFPMDLRVAVEKMKWERRVKDPRVQVTNADIVADAVRYYLDHCGHTGSENP